MIKSTTETSALNPTMKRPKKNAVRPNTRQKQPQGELSIDQSAAFQTFFTLFVHTCAFLLQRTLVRPPNK